MTILAAFWYPHTTVLVMFVLPVRLWVLAVATVALDLLGMLSLGSGVAHAAHLAGAVYAFVYHRTNGGVERLLGLVDRFAEGRRRERERRRGREEEDLRERIDGILDKVNREGMGALSEEEKRFLKRASERLRR
jgi:hypothetical protein